MAKSLYCPAPRRKNHTSAKPGNYTPPVPGFQRPINSLSNMVLIEELSKRPATPNDETFERVILALIEQARQTGQPYVDIVSGEVHRLVGGYPGRNHKMPTCCKVMYDRADVYIPFIERSLNLLNPKGTLGFICSDRWMKNRYGGPLRKFVANRFNLKAYIDMVDTDAFHMEVSAYPAITIISREKQGATRVSHRPKVDKNILKSLSKEILSQKISDTTKVREVAGIVNANEPWLLESTDQVNLLRKIENNYPTLEEVGCKVGIGVATGADKIYIQDFAELDIEEDRKIPLVTTKDIQTGEINWLGQCVINTFNDDGGLVNLKDYPKLSRFLYLHEELIKNRHVAKKAPDNWFRTIDRVWPDLTTKEKLLIPDIKGEAHIVYESGTYYPHHNLYYVTSEEWNLRALQAVLLSSIAKLFIGTYSTKIRGGYLRFQAQYLRRIRIPKWEDVSPELRQELIDAAKKRDIEKCNKAVFKLYELNQEERSALGGNGE
jgi:hypothetical protein